MKAELILLLVLVAGLAAWLVTWAVQTRALRGRHRRPAR